MERTNSIIDVDGIRVGHAQDASGITGCSVVYCEHPAVGGVDQRGGAPGTRETDLLRPMHMVSHVDAVLLTGGSAYGLDAAGGVMRRLEEIERGFPVGVGVVPIVPAAVIFDLGVGSPTTRPDNAMGYAAASDAIDGNSKSCPVGCVGAGTGATVGKLLGMEHAMKSGIGSASIEILPGLMIGALVVVNAFGDIIDPADGSLVAGVRSPETGQPAGTLALMQALAGAQFAAQAGTNTVIGVVATNAKLSKEETNKLAQMAQDGIAMSVRPAHSMFDGDTLFALSTGLVKVDFNLVGAFAAQVTAAAILNAVHSARSLGALPCAADL
ncbi:MAG: P1 family peptidase [Anaerolineae bacterium]|nr:P1 family peptidase [Anaerolineae bacterium]